MTFQDLEQDHPVRLSSLLLKPLYVAKDTENSKKIHMTRVSETRVLCIPNTTWLL